MLQINHMERPVPLAEKLTMDVDLRTVFATGDVILRDGARNPNWAGEELVVCILPNWVEAIAFRQEADGQLVFPIKITVPIVRRQLRHYSLVGRCLFSGDLPEQLEQLGCRCMPPQG